MAKHRWLFAWGLGTIAAGAASLLVPLYVVQLGGDPLELGLLGAVAALLGTPGAVFWGRLADRTANPRGIILFSLVGVGVLLGAMPLTTSIPLLIVANAFLWLVFAAAGPVLTLLVVADVPSSEWNREIALLNTYQGYGWAGGLLLGIVWSVTVETFVSATVAQQSLFVVCGGAAILAAVLLSRWMPAPSVRKLRRIDPERVARRISKAPRLGIRSATFLFSPNRLYWSTRTMHPRRLAQRFTPTLATYYIAVLLFFTGFAAFFAPLPLYLSGVGFSSDMIYALYLIISLGSAVFYGAAGRVSGRMDLRLLQTGALSLRGVAIPLVAVVGTAFAATAVGTVLTGVLFVLVGVSWAVIAVTAGTIVTRIAPTGLRGEALGMYTALSLFAGAVGSIAGGAVATAYGFTVAFAAAGLVILVGGGLVLALKGISSGTRTVGEAESTQ